MLEGVVQFTTSSHSLSEPLRPHSSPQFAFAFSDSIHSQKPHSLFQALFALLGPTYSHQAHSLMTY